MESQYIELPELWWFWKPRITDEHIRRPHQTEPSGTAIFRVWGEEDLEKESEKEVTRKQKQAKFDALWVEEKVIQGKRHNQVSWMLLQIR